MWKESCQWVSICLVRRNMNETNNPLRIWNCRLTLSSRKPNTRYECEKRTQDSENSELHPWSSITWLSTIFERPKTDKILAIRPYPISLPSGHPPFTRSIKPSAQETDSLLCFLNDRFRDWHFSPSCLRKSCYARKRDLERESFRAGKYPIGKRLLPIFDRSMEEGLRSHRFFCREHCL